MFEIKREKKKKQANDDCVAVFEQNILEIFQAVSWVISNQNLLLARLRFDIFDI